MQNELDEFHRSCKDEYKELLKHFNLAFYGYGNKKRILKELFPSAIEFNMRFSTPKTIAEDLVLQGYGGKANSTLEDIDKWLAKKKKTIQLVVFNFDFKCTEFRNLENIKIIATIENIDIKLELEDFELFNFILRDLTTFEDYDQDILDMELFDNKVSNVLMILKNLSPKSRAAFKELLEVGSCEIETIFNKVKKALFLTKVSTLIDLLREFVDHKVIKIHENKMNLMLNKDERAKVLGSMQEKK